ncbi:MAG TPA: N-acetyl-D-Glu racemase DgcA [Stellaceae bacterium]|jgi:L-alanine-DL-glutamate epimerase-like enolase superfamily enzyme
MRRLTVRAERWKLARPFAISRGTKTEAEVVVVEIADGAARGRGESVPYPRYGESVEGVIAEIEAVAGRIAEGLGREALLAAMLAGAARNAVDAALWDLEAKQTGRSVWEIAGLSAPPAAVTTAFTIGLDTPEAMGEAARREAHRPLLKLKVTGEGDVDRVRAVRAGAPGARIIVDANEGWTADHLADYGPALAGLGVALIEQPLPAGKDEALRGIPHPVPLCADESCHLAADLDALVGKYEFVNVKLDKTGGLTEALRLVAAARAKGLRVMVGCMVGTSLAMAPALLPAQDAEIVDLDGPLLLAADRQPGLRIHGSLIYPPQPALWG